MKTFNVHMQSDYLDHRFILPHLISHTASCLQQRESSANSLVVEQTSLNPSGMQSQVKGKQTFILLSKKSLMLNHASYKAKDHKQKQKHPQTPIQILV